MRAGGVLLLILALAGCAGCAASPPADRPGARALDLDRGGRWIGNAVCYGPHRDGQRPGGPSPTADEIREDLGLMLPQWNLLRLYGAGGAAETVLEVIRDDDLDMKVMLGVWIAPDAPTANRAEIDAAVRLATAYDDIVAAVAVGNETQVSWSAHRSSPDSLVAYVRAVRAAVAAPVTVADDYSFWNKPESRRVAADIDFLTVHAHPMWNGKQLDEALPWVAETLASVQSLHPDRLLVLGETGWATSVHTEGEQAELIRGKPGAAQQKIFHDAVRAWAESTGQAVFWFEAFDENWKGGPHPAEVEKHWGVFRADRTAKSAE